MRVIHKFAFLIYELFSNSLINYLNKRESCENTDYFYHSGRRL